MIVRIFYGSQVSDLNLDQLGGGRGAFTLGGAPEDGMTVPGLMRAHVTFRRGGDQRWVFSDFAGPVLTQQGPAQRGLPDPREVYLLDPQHRISFIVLEETLLKTETLSLTGLSEITVGRGSKNVIEIPSRIISQPHCTLTRRGADWVLADPRSTNGTYVAGAKVREHVLKPGDEIVAGNTTLRFQGTALQVTGQDVKLHAPKAAGTQDPRVNYVRSPRLRQTVEPSEMEIEPAPSIGGKPEINWLSTLLPAAGTAVVAIVMSVFFSPLMLVFTLPMTILGVLVTVLNYRKQTSRYTQQQQLRIGQYNHYLAEVSRQAEGKLQAQMAALTSSDPDLSGCMRIVTGMDRALWERRPTDPDFGSVRLGSGTVPGAVTFRVPKTGLALEQDELQKRPQQIAARFASLNGAPITCDLRRSQICGIIGPRQATVKVLQGMVMQLATTHSYHEAKVVVVADRDDRPALGWVGMLPHCMDESRKSVYYAETKEDAADLLDRFADDLKARRLDLEAESGSFGAAPVALPFVVFLFAQPAFLSKDSAILDYLLKGRDLGVATVLLAGDLAQLPKECNLIIDCQAPQAQVYHKDNAAQKQLFQKDDISDQDCRRFGEAMNRIYCDEGSGKRAIPQRYTFLEMLGVPEAGALDIGALWARSDVIKSLAAPIGMGENGRQEFLDLHETAHGPHGLVAGTTGSGKSELLQSYVLSVAAHYHPYDVAFVIIDFKGGGMADQFRGLPHLLGAITNIDGDEINRSLKSIDAELEKRELLFREAGVSKIEDYIALVKQGKVSKVLPHLIILVDEFAELKAEQPEFMSKLVSASRVGRSLGIHLILATQRPTGQVNDQIWSNSKFQMCLKVETREDSNDVIKSPLAASLKDPGRAYLRVKEKGMFDLFQSGYSGARDERSGRTQLEAVVAKIRDYCQRQGIEKLPDICLPALPTVVPFAPTPSGSPGAPITVQVGRYDAPSRQEQGDLTVDLSAANIMVIGSPQKGKTNFLQAILRGAAEAYSPEQVSFYIIDFASMILKNFEHLSHVGSVVTPSEDEKLENLFKMLSEEIGKRQAAFAGLGVSSYGAYLEAGRYDLPQVVLMVDNFTVLRELYPDETETLLTICREGLTAGISVVLSNSQMSGLGYQYLQNFSGRFALYCNDSGEYNTLFNRSRLSVKKDPGRTLTELDHEIVDGQISLAFPGEREIDRVQEIRRFIDDTAARWGGARARPIPVVPETVTLPLLREMGLDAAARDYRVPIGMDFSTMELAEVDMNRQGLLAVSGAEQSGKTNLVKRIVSGLQAHIFENLTSVYLLDGSGDLRDLYEYGCVAEHTGGAREAEELIGEVYGVLQDRRDQYQSDRTGLDQEPMLLLAVTGDELVPQLLKNQAVSDKLLAIAKDLHRYKGFVLLGDIENAPITYASPSVLKYAKESHNLFVMENIDAIALQDIPLKLKKRFARPVRCGDGFSLIGGKVKKVRTILFREEDEDE